MYLLVQTLISNSLFCYEFYLFHVMENEVQSDGC